MANMFLPSQPPILLSAQTNLNRNLIYHSTPPVINLRIEKKFWVEDRLCELGA